MSLFEIKEDKIMDNKYTKKVNIPQYLPKNVKPNIMELCNDTKTVKLINEIKNSNVTDEEKEFFNKGS